MIDARSLKELELLPVVRLYRLEPAVRTSLPPLHALAAGAWLFVGEPFAEAAGKLLDGMLAAVGCPREGDAGPFAEADVDAIRPRIIVALGEAAANRLLGAASLESLRGTVHRYRGIPLVTSYHPASLLDGPADKARAWEDLVLARRTLATG